jgi:rhodanese-related sulfurtransferase
MAHQHSEGFLKIVNDSKSRVKEVNVSETLDRMRKNPSAVLVDVREDSEWAAGHAAPAKHLGKGIIERDIEAAVPDHSTEVILYCGGGFRSALAGDALQKMGYTNVYSMAGGWRAWNEAGAPTSKD